MGQGITSGCSSLGGHYDPASTNILKDIFVDIYICMNKWLPHNSRNAVHVFIYFANSQKDTSSHFTHTA